MTLRGSQPNGSVRTWRRHFPITSVDNVLDLVREILLTSGYRTTKSSDSLSDVTAIRSRVKAETLASSESADSYVSEPDLAFVSIVLGFIENRLTIPTSDPNCAKVKSTPTVRAKPRISHRSRSRHSSTTSSTGSKVVPSPLSLYSAESSDTPTEPVQSSAFLLDTPSPSTPCMVTGEHLSSNTVEPTPTTHSTRSRLRPRQPRNYAQLNNSGLYDSSASESVGPLGAELSSSFTETVSSGKRRRFSDTCTPKSSFPCLAFEQVEQLYQDFYSLIMTSAKLQPYIRTTTTKNSNSNSSSPATRSLIRAVCDVLWNRMASGKYKEKLTHTQSIYSFLTTGILDSFGLAYTTVAACQLLGYPDVDLTLSEDHGWVEFGSPDCRQSADVATYIHNMHTSHDCTSSSDQTTTKQEDHNPPPIRMPPLTNSWLYVNGFPVLCRPRILAMVAAVTALQPGASLPTSSATPHSAPTVDPPLSNGLDLVTPSGLARHLSSSPTISMQLITLKHRLLWMFYNAGCLAKYPLGLTNLADLEDAFPSTTTTVPGPTTSVVTPSEHSTISTAPSVALDLYLEAVRVTQTHYSNQHVYPYTCLAGYLYRHEDNRGALHYWSKAAQVIGQYNHSSEDWEIYRELLEIATQLMPHMFRSAAEASRSCSEGSVKADPDGCLYQPANVLDDPQCLAYLLSFYDHLCLWEEGSSVPVLHVGWVDKLMVNLVRFSARARRLLRISAHQPKDSLVSHPTTEPDNLAPLSPASSISSLPRRSSNRPRTRTPTVQTISSGSSVTQPLKVQVASPLVSSCVSVMSPSPLASPAIGDPIPNSPSRTVLNSDVNTKKPKRVELSTVASLPADDGPTPVADALTKVEVTNALSNLYHEPETAKMEPEMEDPDGSPSPPPMSEFSSNEDFITSLVEACDRRLLNPAFLWGVEPNVPFLPADVSPEDVFTRLLATLEEPEPLTIDNPASGSLFPTPPNSGSICDAATTEDATDKSRPVTNPGDPIEQTSCEPAREIPPHDDLTETATQSSVPDSELQQRPTSPTPPTATTMDSLYVDLTLYSIKMTSIIDLLRATRLNASAIKLALTAQSQVSVRRSTLPTVYNP